jgi:hypothetical protein
MLAFLAALLAASQPAPPQPAPVLGRTAWLVATVDQSEFCPPGNLRLDLRSGQYQATAGAPRPICNDLRIERPGRSGTLDAAHLATVRAAFLRVVTEGLGNPACLNGGHPQEVVVSNGGTPVLVLTTGAETAAAPDDLSCWSTAATALHNLLEEQFGTPARR